jgi:hypothetical protein
MSVATSALELRSVMIATDFSQASEKPLRHAVAIARTLLHCCGNNLAPNDGQRILDAQNVSWASARLAMNPSK